MAVDSGASETVVLDEMIPIVETEAGVASKRGVQYVVASGELCGSGYKRNQVKDEGAGVQCEQGTTKCCEDGGCWGSSGVREADWRQSWRMRRRHEDIGEGCT